MTDKTEGETETKIQPTPSRNYTDEELSPHLDTIHKQLDMLNQNFSDMLVIANKSYTPIPYYKIALLSQRQFCQSLGTLKTLLPKESAKTD